MTTDLFRCVVALVSFVYPKKTEEEVLAIAAKRAGAIRRKQESGTVGEVLKLEEAAGFLDKDDHRAR